MSDWLDFSNNANKLRQSYFNGFVDVSGGMYLRNDNSLNFYDTTNGIAPKFSIKSDSMHVYEPTSENYYDISNSKLIYIQNVEQDIQSLLIDLSNRSVNPVFSGVATILGTDLSGGKLHVVGDASINGNLFIGGVGESTFNSDVSINGNLYANYPNNSIPTQAVIRGTVYIPTESIIYPHSDGFAQVSNLYTPKETLVPASVKVQQELDVIGDTSLNGRLFLNSNDSLIINGVPFSGTFNGQNGSNFTTDVSMNQNLIISENLYVNGDISTNGNIYANYSSDSIPANAIIGGVGNVHISTDSITYPYDDSFSLIKENSTQTIIPSNITVNGSLAVNNDSYLNGNAHISNLYANNIYLPTNYSEPTTNQFGYIDTTNLTNTTNLYTNNGDVNTYVIGTFNLHPGAYIYSFKVRFVNSDGLSNITRFGITLSPTTEMNMNYGFVNYYNNFVPEDDSITETRSGFIVNNAAVSQSWNVIVTTAYKGGLLTTQTDSFVSLLKVK
jgi:hypothetical protein